MDQRIFHSDHLLPAEIAQALIAEFNHGNLRAQIFGQGDNLAVQVVTRQGASSGGQTALTVTIHKVPDGILVEMGQQDWLGTAASIGRTALVTLMNPWNILSRIDDVAQDVENIQLSEKVWEVIHGAAQAAGASYALSERLSRVICEYCGTANPVGSGACNACGAPLGRAQPGTCPNCGFIVTSEELQCPNCGYHLMRQTGKGN